MVARAHTPNTLPGGITDLPEATLTSVQEKVMMRNILAQIMVRRLKTKGESISVTRRLRSKDGTGSY